MQRDYRRFYERLALARFDPIRVGEHVKVCGERWAANRLDGKRHWRDGVTGTVLDIHDAIQSLFNVDYLVYVVQPDDNSTPFEIYFYVLEKVQQAS